MIEIKMLLIACMHIAHGLQNQVKKNDSTFKSIVNQQKQVALTPNSLQPTSCVI